MDRGIQKEESPLDLALEKNRTQIVGALLAREAPLKARTQGQLDLFIRQTNGLQNDRTEEDE